MSRAKGIKIFEVRKAKGRGKYYWRITDGQNKKIICHSETLNRSDIPLNTIAQLILAIQEDRFKVMYGEKDLTDKVLEYK